MLERFRRAAWAAERVLDHPYLDALLCALWGLIVGIAISMWQMGIVP